MGLKHKKYLGQHFLRNPRAITEIVAALDLRPGEPVVEIGPGGGALTGPLLAAGARVVAIEVDADRIDGLRFQFGGEERFRLLHADVLDLAFAEICELAGGGFKLAANLPYNVATTILARLLPHAAAGEISVFVVMLQREVAERILASPRTKEYGYLTVMARVYCDSERILNLGPGSFVPPPKVDSTVLRMVPRPQPHPLDDAEGLLTLARAAFARRRKTLANNLVAASIAADRTQAESWIATAGFASAVRGEELSLQDFEVLLRLVRG